VIESSARSADSSPPTSRRRQPGLRPFHEAAALLLGDPREDRNQQVSHGATCVEPALANGDHLHANAVQFEDLREVTRHGPAEPIELPNDEHVEGAALGVSHHLVVLGPLLGRRRLLFVDRDDLQAASTSKPLDVGPLALGRLRVG